MKDRYIHAVSVTDASGAAIQHLEIDRREIREPPLKLQQGREQYMAFGEVFVDERRTGFGTPYKLNGKEFDCESGYYYYGARYYDPRMARFLSAVSPRASHGMDPLAGEFPSQSSYLYAYNNPVRMIDVDGLYGDESEANQQRELAKSQGHFVGEVYQSGDEWGFNVVEKGEGYSSFDKDFSQDPSNRSGGVSLTRAIGQISFSGGISGEAMKLSSSSFRLRTSSKPFSPKLYSSGWAGNQYTSTFKLSGVGKALGGIGFGIGLFSDSYGLATYYNQGSSHPDAVSPGKFGVNTSIGLYGLFGGIGGAAFSPIYFGFEAFYPGGFGQALQDKSSRDTKTSRILGRHFNSMNLGANSPFKQ